MAWAMDYVEHVKQCMLWAETAELHEAFEAFLALAEVWRRIADLGHQASAQGDAFFTAQPQQKPRLCRQAVCLDSQFDGARL